MESQEGANNKGGIGRTTRLGRKEGKEDNE
jgi:hypothetical protein